MENSTLPHFCLESAANVYSVKFWSKVSHAPLLPPFLFFFFFSWHLFGTLYQQGSAGMFLLCEGAGRLGAILIVFCCCVLI